MHSTVPSTWPLLFALALLPVLIWLVAAVLVGLGLALGIVEWGDRPWGEARHSARYLIR